MDNQPVVTIDNRKPKNKWKPVAVVFIVLLLAAIAVGGFIFFKIDGELTDAKKKNDDNARTISSLEKDLASAKSSTDSEGAKTNYLEVKEWGIKFMVPEGLDGIKYTMGAFDDMPNTITFSSPKLTAAGCTSNLALGIVKKVTDLDTSGGYIINFSAKQFNNAYYVYTMPQGSACDETATIAQTQLLMQMLYTIEPSK